jgi:type I restriction enzyme S subunit
VGVVPLSDPLTARWVALSLQGKSVRRFFVDRLNTTVQKTLNLRDVASLRIPCPPAPEMRTITELLGALDDKIESNRRTANAARALLMQAPPSTGELSPLDQAAGFYNGGALTKHATGSGRPILRIKELRAGVTADTPRTDAPVRETHEVASGELLFSWSGTLLTTRWCGEPAVLNQHVFRVDPLPGLSRWFVEAWIERHLDTFRAIAADKATTMGHIQRHHLSEALVALPPRDETDALMRTYDPLDRLRMSLLDEAERLAAIRDALLPRLVSGRLRVPVADDPDKAIDTVLATVQQSKRQHSAASNGVQASPPVRLNGTRPVDVAP